MTDQTSQPAEDPEAARSEGGEELQAANTFDLRRIIAGLFFIYGAILTILGLFDSSAEVAKAAGVRINLWAGIGMLIFAALMLWWGLARPLGQQLAEADAAVEARRS